MSGVNRCFAVSLLRMATGTDVSAIYVSEDTSEGCCHGGLYRVGYAPVSNEIKYFVSTGKKDVRGGAAEYLKASPELVERCDLAAGRSVLPENISSCRHAKPFRIRISQSDRSVASARASRSGTWRRSSISTVTIRFHRSLSHGVPPVRPSSRSRQALRKTRPATLRSWARRTRHRTVPSPRRWWRWVSPRKWRHGW